MRIRIGHARPFARRRVHQIAAHIPGRHAERLQHGGGGAGKVHAVAAMALRQKILDEIRSVGRALGLEVVIARLPDIVRDPVNDLPARHRAVDAGLGRQLPQPAGKRLRHAGIGRLRPRAVGRFRRILAPGRGRVVPCAVDPCVSIRAAVGRPCVHLSRLCVPHNGIVRHVGELRRAGQVPNLHRVFAVRRCRHDGVRRDGRDRNVRRRALRLPPRCAVIHAQRRAAQVERARCGGTHLQHGRAGRPARAERAHMDVGVRPAGGDLLHGLHQGGGFGSVPGRIAAQADELLAQHVRPRGADIVLARREEQHHAAQGGEQRQIQKRQRRAAPGRCAPHALRQQQQHPEQERAQHGVQRRRHIHQDHRHCEERQRNDHARRHRRKVDDRPAVQQQHRSRQHGKEQRAAGKLFGSGQPRGQRDLGNEVHPQRDLVDHAGYGDLRAHAQHLAPPHAHKDPRRREQQQHAHAGAALPGGCGGEHRRHIDGQQRADEQQQRQLHRQRKRRDDRQKCARQAQKDEQAAGRQRRSGPFSLFPSCPAHARTSPAARFPPT